MNRTECLVLSYGVRTGQGGGAGFAGGVVRLLVVIMRQNSEAAHFFMPRRFTLSVKLDDSKH